MKFKVKIEYTAPNGKIYESGLLVDYDDFARGREQVDVRVGGLLDKFKRFVDGKKWEDGNEVPDA